MFSATISTEDARNPNVLSTLFPDEVLKSVYWQHRGSNHKKQMGKDDLASISNAYDSAAGAIRDANFIVFVTGAGASVDPPTSLPDFRSSNEFWSELQHPGISRYEDSSDNKLFETEPAFMWGLNFHQMQMYRTAGVHSGYEAMLKISQLPSLAGNYFCYTSNIDGMLQRAGFDSSRVREIHGNIHRLQCTSASCRDQQGTSDAWVPATPVELAYDRATMMADTTRTPLPRCRNCQTRLARPNVWFCHDTDYVYHKSADAISRAYQALCDDMEERNRRVLNPDARCKTVVVEVGCGLIIPSGRVEAEDLVERLGGTLIRINPVDYMVPEHPAHASIGLPVGAAEALTEIYNRL